MSQFDQEKLSKSEWESIEIPASDDEKSVYKLICEGFNDVSISTNDTLCIFDFLKIKNTKEMNAYIFKTFLQTTISKLINKYSILTELPTMPSNYNKALKTKDKIRIESSIEKIIDKTDVIIEYVILTLFTSMCKLFKQENKTTITHQKCTYFNKWLFNVNNKQVTIKCKQPIRNAWMKQYYTITTLINYNFPNMNIYFKDFINQQMELFNSHISHYDKIHAVLKYSKSYLENNSAVLKYKNKTLYSHQKQLFSVFNRDDVTIENTTPKLIFYSAPTGTGKTLSPIGLAKKYKIIFVCAARHVGLSLAKVAVNMGIKTAFAFGCSCLEDIRLHYFAAKEFTIFKNGKRKVDNMVGDNVQIMISDVASYEISMCYMKAFNPLKNMILYWDEPTITMDYADHPLHQIIHNNWTLNQIPNVILSSATLPTQHEIPQMILGFKHKFENAEHLCITSHDYFKTVCVLSKKGVIAVPHKLFPIYDDALDSVKHLERSPTLLRYLDVNECCRFILLVCKHIYINIPSKQDVLFENYFQDVKNLTITTIKQYYLTLIKHLPEELWVNVYEHFMNDDPISVNVQLTTTDAHTLTNGPTIYLTDDIETVAQHCIKTANIPSYIITDIVNNLTFNQSIMKNIDKKEKDYEDMLQKDDIKDKKLEKNNISSEMKQLQNDIVYLKKQIKNIMLNDLYIPNRLTHYEHWVKSSNQPSYYKSNVFSCSMDEDLVERIMQLEKVDTIWKILLLMGIGAFTKNNNGNYQEIMKEMAQKQQLYLIIASSDYIYGTNYQFCHSYIGKGLINLTQEKLIQALGRVGRKSIQHNYTIRFRDDDLLTQLFLPDVHKPEVTNMNRLFCYDM